ncbi:MAG: L-threonylcarbamoyladenylate synthase, partial [Bacteroidota bacterium]|nr:L-threonylcarbamoyladenylate synthase [Bacteroidota bacterium]
MYSFKDDIKSAISVLKSGGVILYPTDTVWGLGCDACNANAVERLFQIKQREDTKSMLVLVDSDFMIERYIKEVPEIAWQLIDVAEKPLTIIYPGARSVAPSLMAKDGSLAIRLSKEKFSSELIGRFRRPVVSTSANISGALSPSVFSEISQEIINQVDYVVNYRQDDHTYSKPSEIIKIALGG